MIRDALARVDLERAETVFEPPGPGEGHWVGAPSVARRDGTTYLAVRWRSPDRRGYAVAVYERTAGSYRELTRVSAADLGVASVERPALVVDPDTDDLKLYLPVDRDENDWRILRLEDARNPEGFAPATARPVLVPGSAGTDRVTIKDPSVVVTDERYYMFYAGHDGTSEQAHLATSTDGEDWTRAPTNPVVGRDGWHDHHVRVSAALLDPESGEWVVTYDGSGRGDYGRTWNLRTGIAVGEALSAPTDATPAAPALAAPPADTSTGLETFGTCRYVDAAIVDDELVLYAEVARVDGSFDLRRATVAVA